MFAVITDLDGVEAREVREVRAHGDSLPTLLVTWLNECLYVHEVEGFVAREVELVALDESPRVGGEPFRIHGILRGEELDPGRHSRGISVTGALLDGGSVGGAGGGFETRVVLSAR
jgi:SHS2 domain-containing protein